MDSMTLCNETDGGEEELLRFAETRMVGNSARGLGASWTIFSDSRNDRMSVQDVFEIGEASGWSNGDSARVAGLKGRWR